MLLFDIRVPNVFRLGVQMCCFKNNCSTNNGLCWGHIMSGIAPPSCKYQVSGQCLVRMIISQKSLRYSVAFTIEIVQLLMISDDGFSDDRWRVPHSCGCLRPTADSVFLINCYLTIHYTLHTHFTTDYQLCTDYLSDIHYIHYTSYMWQNCRVWSQCKVYTE